MLIIKHLWELILFLTILVGPLPLSLSFALHNQKEKDNSSSAHFWLVILTVSSIIEISLGLILGTFEKLTLNTVIFSEIFIFIIGFSLIIARRYSFSVVLQKLPKLKQPLNRIELLIISSAAAVALVLLLIIATKPITNYDSLWFHLPAISRWYQTGALTLLDPTGNWMFDHQDAIVYPYNWHILNLLCVLPFGEDFLVTFPQLIAWIIQGISVYLLSIYFGASRLNSMAASSLLLTVPMVINQVNTIHIDLPLSALFTVSLYFGLSYYSRRIISDFALFLAALGLFAGIKITAIIYGAFILGGLAILELRKIWLRPKNTQFNFQLKSPLLFLGIALLLFLGGFWYVRNILHINHPIPNLTVLSPSRPVSPPPKNLEPPEYLKIWKSTLLNQFDITKISNWQIFVSQIIARLQLPFIAMSCQILALLVFTSFKKRLSPINEKLVTLIILLFGTGFLYFITPFSSGTGGEIVGQLGPLLGFNLRYGFPFLSTIAVTAAVSATLVRTRDKLIVSTVLISSIVGIFSSEIFDAIKNASFTGNSIIWGSKLIDQFKYSPIEASKTVITILGPNLIDICRYVGIYLIYLLFIYLLTWQLSQGGFLTTLLPRLQRLSQTIVICSCIVLIASTTWVWRENREVNRTEIYQGMYDYIEKNTLPGEKIGFFLSHRSYLLYGKNLNRQVLYIPFREKTAQGTKWADNLRQNGVKIVALGPLTSLDENTKKTVSWLTSDDGYLESVWGENVNQKSVLYRLRSK
ncbi:hypothetical protein PN499_24900 [Kamptonema animale CS-326]|jgi:membrane protein CcdC involved in cytochrome C biogenesis|uniref:hypothetical protein n=1 Tax=Kamptonema animale TaxID=92934 RepID=UPI00232C63A5|nr:hypothetical protein [Kamptonema animale]MDB9514443.1 hypothetical protein [Kamptonema animale CS-326]